MLAAACVLVTGCAFGDKDSPTDRPNRELAATPESLPPAAEPLVTPSGGAAPGSPGTAGSGGATLRPPAGSSSARPGATIGPRPTAGTTRPGATLGPGAPYRVVGATGDRTNDTEGSGADYGDLVAVSIEDDGANARVTVTFDADLPARLPAEETMGVGVDFFRSATQVESDYQLFADGQPEGWFAYLQTPKGFVRYPGRFGIGGRRLEFVVPWSALGSPESGRFSAFADWSRDAAPLNQFSEDHAPNLGNASYAR